MNKKLKSIETITKNHSFLNKDSMILKYSLFKEIFKNIDYSNLLKKVIKNFKKKGKLKKYPSNF